MNAPDDEARLVAFLRDSGVAARDEQARFTPLAGGVSSDIWRVDLPGRSVCVKRALAQLKVAAEWKAPVSRNANEWAWLCFAREHVPDAVPEPLAHDAAQGLFAMAYLPAGDYALWKAQLLAGEVDTSTASAVGRLVGRLHQASTEDPEVATTFDTLPSFHALRLEPYLLATAERHPDIADRLRLLAGRTAAGRLALVHGDVSPKNILVGPRGPVLLDAECAWFGDPAFDLAFCLNHLLLKCLVRPERTQALLHAAAAMRDAYLDEVRFEPHEALEARIASLLPALMLARVDGKSPVEYLVDRPEAQQAVRDAARPLIARPRGSVDAVADAWLARLQA